MWKTYIGEVTRSNCMCCNNMSIEYGNFDCGHIVAESNGGETNLDNLRPICRLCNSSMGTKNMIEFMKNNGFRCDKINNRNI